MSLVSWITDRGSELPEAAVVGGGGGINPTESSGGVAASVMLLRQELVRELLAKDGTVAGPDPNTARFSVNPSSHDHGSV